MDTLKYVKYLEEAGFSRSQAEKTVEMVNEVVNTNFATKRDLNEEITAVRTDMKTEFTDVRAEMRAEFANVRAEMNTGFTGVTAEFAAVRKELAAVQAETKTQFVAVRSEIRDLESRITIKVGLMIAASIGIIHALSKMG